MVYLKSLSIKIISIYISLFLIFSPLYGQTNDNLKEDAFSDEKKKYKLIMISGSEVMFDSFVQLSGDSLRIASDGSEQYISIGLIKEIKIIKKSKIGKSLLIGTPLGFLFGWRAGKSKFPEKNNSDEIFSLIYAAIGTVLGVTISILVGVDDGIDEVHNLSNLPLLDKISLIHRLMDD